MFLIKHYCQMHNNVQEKKILKLIQFLHFSACWFTMETNRFFFFFFFFFFFSHKRYQIHCVVILKAFLILSSTYSICVTPVNNERERKKVKQKQIKGRAESFHVRWEKIKTEYKLLFVIFTALALNEILVQTGFFESFLGAVELRCKSYINKSRCRTRKLQELETSHLEYFFLCLSCVWR